MPFRDDEGAARARADVLEQKLGQAQQEIERLRAGETRPERLRIPWFRRPATWLVAIAVFLGTAGLIELDGGRPPWDVLFPFLGAASVLSAMAALATMALSLRTVAGPAEVLVFMGRGNGFQVVGPGGARVRVPLLERVERLDVSPMDVPVVVENAFAKGGAVLRLEATARVRVDRIEPGVDRAIERFLGRSRDEIATVARETIEGSIRAELARLERAEIDADRERFDEHVLEKCVPELGALGLRIDRFALHAATPRDP